MPDPTGYIPNPQLPEGSMATACLLVVHYINPDGEACYAVCTKGESPTTSYLGLTVLAQQHILREDV